METDTNTAEISIAHLPDEIITIILLNCDLKTIVSFGSTCRRFYHNVNDAQIFWKEVFKKMIPSDIFIVIEKYGTGDWLQEFKEFIYLKRIIYSELIAMSPKNYWNTHYHTGPLDIGSIFNVATSTKISYYTTIYILQDVIRQGNSKINKGEIKKPFTLTEMHYAKAMLSYLVQSYLAVKWTKYNLHTWKANDLPPELTINFFLQWIDSMNLHRDADVEKSIAGLAQKVENCLADSAGKNSKSDIQEKCVSGVITQRRILAAISEVIYHQLKIPITTAANLETLDIPKVACNNCGNVLTIAAIYQAVARRFGVKLELIAFPNHFFLEWRDKNHHTTEIYTVDLETGELRKKRRCPFSQSNHDDSLNYKYNSDLFLQYIYSVFNISFGSLRSWNTLNASNLLDFLNANTHDNVKNHPFLYFKSDLLRPINLPVFNTPLSMECLSEEFRKLLLGLSNFLNNTQDNKEANKDMIIRKHDSRVKFAVGMICYHKKYNYTCVIRGWDVVCTASTRWQEDNNVRSLYFGAKQPFYNVMAADQTDRYVAQENLMEPSQPARLYHLEDIIAKDFTHYDGFAYVLNDEKKAEYPDEAAISSMYCTRAKLKARRESASESLLHG